MGESDPQDRDPSDFLNGPIAEGDGRGIGPTLGPDVSVEAERREIERGVYERRTARDRAVQDRKPPREIQPEPPQSEPEDPHAAPDA